MREGKKFKKTGEHFFKGSGKFLVFVIFVYALFFGINKLIDISKQKESAFVADNIEINGNVIMNRTQVLSVCGFKSNVYKLENIDTYAISEKLLKSYFIKGVSITKRLPRTLNITIEEREPIAFICGRGLNLIDEQGYLIPVPDAKIRWDLPLISKTDESLGKLGDKTISEKAKEAIRILSYIRDQSTLLYGLISELNPANSEYYELYLVKGGAKIRLSKLNYKKELHILKGFLTDYFDWAKLGKVEYIDLRFQNQLVLKEREGKG